jgi:hypothetical protein
MPVTFTALQSFAAVAAMNFSGRVGVWGRLWGGGVSPKHGTQEKGQKTTTGDGNQEFAIWGRVTTLVFVCKGIGCGF